MKSIKMEKKYLEWLSSSDTGVSSETLMYALHNVKKPYPDIPHDPSDFGRIYRMFTKFPELENRLDEVLGFDWGHEIMKKRMNEFIVQYMDIKTMYESELGQEYMPRTYELLKRLRKAP
jgi:hypothetical protein